MLDIRDTESLLRENRKLRARLEELEETLRAIRGGEVDALVVFGAEGEQIYTLRGALEPYRVMVETMSEGAVTLAQNGTIFYCNGRFASLVKTPQEYIVSLPLHDWIAPQHRDKFDALLAQSRNSIVHEELSLQTGDGDLVPVYVSMCSLPESAGKGIAAVITDISELVAAAEAKSRLAMIVESSDDAIFGKTLDGIITSWNKGAERMYGYSADEAIGQPLSLLMPPDREKELVWVLDAVNTGKHIERFETVRRKKNGEDIAVSLSVFPVTGIGGNIVGAATVARDITERKRAEDALHRANRTLQTLSAGNMALQQATSEEELLRTITNVIVEKGGYSLARVLFAEDNVEKSIMPIAWSSSDDSPYWAECLSWADTEQSQLPIVKAIRSGTTQICHDIASEPAFKPWKEAARARGYVSNIALPFFRNGKVFGGLCIYASEENAFDAEEVRLLEELANDLGYGIVTLRTRKAHEQHETILRQSLEQSIQAIAGTVEARDPYTAGHQRRVADLATAIAREMRLSEEQINGIHLAAIIHDLGKIHVPAEILSKPGKLSEIEFMLIQTHPQAGYDIIKDVKFPWPIADIILQHHEKLDGSGYPQGLKGEQILLESRIITVADVVEAISSHRPYRPGLGLEAALEELQCNRGVQYDPQVVDACLKLFQEQGYKLPL